MKILRTQKLSIENIIQQITAIRSQSSNVESIVQTVIKDVRKNGDVALIRYAKKFDGAKLNSLKVNSDEIKTAYKKVDPLVIKALKKAKANIAKFHFAQLRKKEAVVQTQPGVKVWREFRPIAKVGLYVPGGRAAYPSTVLMLAVPAKIAGCQKIVITTPCDQAGNCNPYVLVSADLCGIKEIYKVGGAGAIAALAYGTETIPQVYKIFGPGNQYVTTAKLQVFGQVAIDMPAGPSEILVLADETANPTWIAADLLSQLEHGSDSQAILIFLPPVGGQYIDPLPGNFLKKIIKTLKKQLNRLPRREIIKQSLQKSFAIITQSQTEAIDLINSYAPEHLEIVTFSPQKFLKKINNAGSIFLGPYSSEPLGDYATGANHTLPTSGFAKMFSPLSIESFGNYIQIQKITKQGFKNLAPTVETLAEIEGLSAHKNAITIRRDEAPPRLYKK